MRTTVDLPEVLLAEARKLSNHRTIRETLIAALEELVRHAKREALRGMAGTVRLDLDLAKSRERARK